MLDAANLPITFENTRLRPLAELDADAYAAGTKDEAVRRFAHLPEPDYTPAVSYTHLTLPTILLV